MQKRDWRILFGSISVFALLCLVLLFIGSFLDLSLAKDWYFANNFYSQLFIAISPFPLLVCLSCSGFFLFRFLKQSIKLSYKILSWICLILFPFLGAFFLSYESLSNLVGSFALSLLISLPIALVFTLLGCLLFKNTPAEKCLTYALFLSLICALNFLLTHTIDNLAGRPSYLAILEHGEMFYHSWWEWNSNLSSTYPAEEASLFTSFPCVSSASASLAFILPLPLFSFDKKKKLSLFFPLICLLWWLLCALAPILNGTAYLSDVAFSGLFFSFLALLVLAPLLFSVKEEGTKRERLTPTSNRYVLLRRTAMKYEKMTPREVLHYRRKRLRQKRRK